MKIRTITSGIGIIVGIAALVACFNFTETAEKEILKTVAGLNTSLVIIKNNINPQNSISKKFPLTSFDLELLRKISFIENGSSLKIRHSTFPPLHKQMFPVIGASSEIFEILKMKYTGRIFSKFDDHNATSICVIGQSAKQKIFSKKNAIGNYIKIFNTDFLVIGIITTSDKTPYNDVLESIIIPYNTLNKVNNYDDFPEMFFLKHTENIQTANFSESIKNFLKSYKPDQAFEIWDQSELIAKKKKTVRIIEWLVNSIPLLILFVASINAANMMIVIVNERTREIGLRIAMGATQNNILFMFLKEGMVLFLISGGIGIILGYFVTVWFVTPLPGLISGYKNWTFSFSILSVIKSIFVLFIAAVFSSLIPAIKSARLEPSIALRYE